MATALNSLSQFLILSPDLITVCWPIAVIVTVFVINNVRGVAGGAQSTAKECTDRDQKDRINVCLALPNLSTANDKGN